MPSSSTLKIDLAVIEDTIRRFAQYGELMPMIKANAYGVGATLIAPYLQAWGIPIVGVSQVNEAIALRKAGIDIPIFVLSAPPFEAKEVVQYRLQPAVNSFEEAAALNQAAHEKLPVHVNVNTGMNRFGVATDQAIALAQAIREAPRLELEGIMTHFAAADLPEMDAFTHQQISQFKSIVDSLDPPPRWVHAANGPGVRFSLPFCNLIRIGVPLFESALTLETHLSFIHEAKKGQTVGYHRTYPVKQDMPIGVIPFGYYDGLHRHYKEKGYVRIHGKKAPMIGNICMDFLMVDLTLIPEAKVGDVVTIFDQDLPPQTVASWGNTDVRELLVSIGPRTKRLYIPREKT